MTWESLNNKHAGKRAVVIGRGPSVDKWVGPLGDDVLIGINAIPLAMKVDYAISGDGDANQWWTPSTTWIRGLPYVENGKETWTMPPQFKLAYVAVDNTVRGREYTLSLTRDQVAVNRRLYCASSSAHPAIHFAWYLGCSELLLVGLDGGGGRCTLTENAPGKSPPSDEVYAAMKVETEKLANRLYPNLWEHWRP